VHKHHWVKEADALRCFDCGATRPAGKRLRCHIGLHAYSTVVKEGSTYEECLYCRKVAPANRFYY
jgi:hypothetical protein